MLNETHENAKKEFQTAINTLEAQVKEHTSNETSLKLELENLKAEIEEKTALKISLKNLEENLPEARNTIKEILSQKELELKAGLKDLEAKKESLSHLEKHVKDLTENAKVKEQVHGDNASEVKSRDIGSTLTTTTASKRKSKKNVESSTAHAAAPTHSSSSNTQNQAPDGSIVTSIKFIMGVALVSAIISLVILSCFKVFLGKEWC
ncbi:hypothetical protein HanPSC8_Chr15g0653751 [Helianthus annuus]|nr:hypothetical protein HanPSC8_Chr15g0653751 [Helianthus annuus]